MKYCSLLATWCVVALADPTLAAESNSRTQQAQREARVLMGRGLEARAAGDHERARQLYLESFSKHPSFDVACNLGHAESDLGRFADAANHFVYCLRNFPTGESLKMKQEAMDGLEKTRQFITELTIDVNETGVLLLLDRQELGVSPLPDAVFVAPGEHQLLGRKGDREVAQHVDFGLGTVERVRLVLPAEKPQAASASEAGGGREPVNPGLRLATSLGLLGLGAAGIGVGIGFSVYAADLEAEERNLRETIAADGDGAAPCPEHPSCPEFSQAIARTEDAQNVALVGFISGGALVAAAGLTYFLWPRRSAESSALYLRPTASFDPETGRAFLSVSGRF